MILGRSPALWAGLAAAALNAAVIVFGVPLTAEGLAALNGLALAAIGVLANATNPTTAGTFALTAEAPAVTVVDTSALALSAPGPSSDPSAGAPSEPTTGPSGGGATGSGG